MGTLSRENKNDKRQINVKFNKRNPREYKLIPVEFMEKEKLIDLKEKIVEYVLYIVILILVGLFVLGLIADKVYGFLTRRSKKNLLDKWADKYE